ncbi:heterokaryon incompatibility protein-domain-containing protein [Rostrohypoxylon terebratum]|nr:heterokaryon incompatibility protein-domain-containing protein [Rostrohypoxylon terebratum]
MASNPSRVTIGNRLYHLVPEDTEGEFTEAFPKLQRFDDPALATVPDFKYKTLPNNKKRIRLLRLKAAAADNPQIFCELIEADYDNPFHIPTIPDIKKDDAQPNPMHNNSNPTQSDNDDSKRLEAQYQTVHKHEIRYEALSWCWGNEPEDYAIIIEEDGKYYKRTIKKGLALALKYLRYTNESRTIWIDSICINQKDDNERNHQVQMMSRIYTRAKQVCIWLGEGNADSKVAIDFIRHEIMELKKFDIICSDQKYATKWQALMVLMQRPWFSRRWMVQEISLAREATIFCGPDEILWKDFAVAVELFVEVETATHRLSEVMQKDEKFRHIPGWFEHVSELGASLLVQATGKVFRTQSLGRNPRDQHGAEKSISDQSTILRHHNTIFGNLPTIDPLERRSLLSLQYLVTTMFIFQTSEPRDVIYSLLAVARDASPYAEKSVSTDKEYTLFVRTGFSHFLEEKPFKVDYGRPYSDVCRDFVEFSIQRSFETDGIQALDILCRPWALEPPKDKSERIKETPALKPDHKQTRKHERRLTKKWMEEVNDRWKAEWKAEHKVWQWEDKEIEWIDQTPNRRKGKASRWKITYNWGWYFGWGDKENRGNSNSGKNTMKGGQNTEKDWTDVKQTSGATKVTDDIKLPSWIPLASSAPFGLFPHPGMHIQKTGRVNADPLVGVPQDGHRNYSAAQTESVDMTALKFRKRPLLGHYSLYVKGFIFDEVEQVTDASQNGSIPATWLELGGWKDAKETHPPDEFWRTLVADRGKDNRNPPYYYARACSESAIKGGLRSGGINTTALINDERNSIIAEFCRRVQAVIWNRRLFKTKAGILGLASDKVRKGDKVGIIYGCTVPVILREHNGKTDEEMRREKFEDYAESLKSVILKCEEKRKRKLDAREANERLKEYARILKITEQSNKKLMELSGAWEKRHIDKKKELNRNEPGGKNQRDSSSSISAEGSSDGGKDIDQKVSGKVKNELEAKKKDPTRYYTLLGESYVHGMMDGEALRKKFYGDIADQTFEIR